MTYPVLVTDIKDPVESAYLADRYGINPQLMPSVLNLIQFAQEATQAFAHRNSDEFDAAGERFEAREQALLEESQAERANRGRGELGELLNMLQMAGFQIEVLGQI